MRNGRVVRYTVELKPQSRKQTSTQQTVVEVPELVADENLEGADHLRHQ